MENVCSVKQPKDLFHRRAQPLVHLRLQSPDCPHDEQAFTDHNARDHQLGHHKLGTPLMVVALYYEVTFPRGRTI